MIKKERDISMKILTLQALLRRLPKDHPRRPQIEKELARRMSGLRGEQSINYELSLLQVKNDYIFQDL
jgi:cytochrome c-type biogenesis protein CcmH/NrfG